MINKSLELIVWITPNELRKIADELDAKMKTVKLGQEVANHSFYGDEVTVHLRVKQEEWRNDNR